jgi:hypothetical protein
LLSQEIFTAILPDKADLLDASARRMVLIGNRDPRLVNREQLIRNDVPMRSSPPRTAGRVVTLDDYWMGRDAAYRHELAETIAGNAAVTVARVNRMLEAMAADGLHAERKAGSHSPVASGWRPMEINARVPAAVPDSPHISGAACDLYDPRNALGDWCVAHAGVLGEIELCLEHPE